MTQAVMEPVYFGSKAWFETARQRLNDDPALKKASATWEGAFRCIIDAEDEEAVKDYTTEEGMISLLEMLSMLSPEDRLKYKGTGLQRVIEKLGFSLDNLPGADDVKAVAEKAKQLTIDDFKDVVIYASFEPYRGTLKEMDPIAPDAKLDAKFTLSGKYRWWKTMCSGKQSVIQLIMSGKMKLNGDLKVLLKYMGVVNAMMKVYTSIPLK